ncbi:unnamed protein product [Spirodela intermedia]|uniref:Uncharacterized protein n=2 Tax=Spirodela intermedia TaxID=51605 RepID=A0A7I8I8J9_SPIIN|nr:unnamed protein product [Spirodela intermedia]CAA6653987.1 unnamed protein product [Spirodela intermedia]CAA7388425.1 unnamed protein product [Spirodela intermedia]
MGLRGSKHAGDEDDISFNMELAEDVIINVKGCCFPIDFLILDMLIRDDLCHAPIILEHPPKLELKPLPNSMKYAFLGPNQTLLVIISAGLITKQEGKIMEVLKKHKGAIG